MAKETTESTTKETDFLRWGGLAGIFGVVMIVASFVAGLFAPALFVPAAPGSACGAPCYVDAALPGFPGVKAAILAENATYMAAITLLIVFFLGLYRGLRKGDSHPSAFFGTGVALLGLALEEIGALPVVAFAHLSRVYQTSGPQGQATLVQVSQAVQAIFNATDAGGGILIAVGFAVLGVAMLPERTGFGKRFGATTMALSLVALGGISSVSIGMDNPNDPFFILLFGVLPLILGWKLFRLARAPPEKNEAATHASGGEGPGPAFPGEHEGSIRNPQNGR